MPRFGRAFPIRPWIGRGAVSGPRAYNVSVATSVNVGTNESEQAALARAAPAAPIASTAVVHIRTVPEALSSAPSPLTSITRQLAIARAGTTQSSSATTRVVQRSVPRAVTSIPSATTTATAVAALLRSCVSTVVTSTTVTAARSVLRVLGSTLGATTTLARVAALARALSSTVAHTTAIFRVRSVLYSLSASSATATITAAVQALTRNLISAATTLTTIARARSVAKDATQSTAVATNTVALQSLSRSLLSSASSSASMSAAYGAQRSLTANSIAAVRSSVLTTLLRTCLSVVDVVVTPGSSQSRNVATNSNPQTAVIYLRGFVQSIVSQPSTSTGVAQLQAAIRAGSTSVTPRSVVLPLQAFRRSLASTISVLTDVSSTVAHGQQRSLISSSSPSVVGQAVLLQVRANVAAAIATTGSVRYWNTLRTALSDALVNTTLRSIRPAPLLSLPLVALPVIPVRRLIVAARKALATALLRDARATAVQATSARVPVPPTAAYASFTENPQMSTYPIGLHDTSPPLDITLSDEKGAVNLSTADQVLFYLRCPAQDVLLVNGGLMELQPGTTPEQGLVRYHWQAGDTRLAGYAEGWIVVLWQDGTQTTFPLDPDGKRNTIDFFISER